LDSPSTLWMISHTPEIILPHTNRLAKAGPLH
jgi:hypothetical protein